jgi:hypothetical protein
MGYMSVGIRTFSRGIGLHEAVSRACFLELWGEPGELWQVLVDEADLGREVVLVNVLGEVAASVACTMSAFVAAFT